MPAPPPAPLLRWGCLVLGLAACQRGGGSGPAAEAGSWTLEPERVAAWIANVPARRPALRDAEFAALVWVDYSLLGMAYARGEPLADSALAAEALAPDLTMVRLRAWHDTLAARRPTLPGDLVDSLFAGDSLRLFQQVLLRVTDPQSGPAVAAARARADSALTRARGGTAFAEVARQYSDDSTAADGGFLPIVRRGVLAPEFERGAWGFRPAQIGGVVSRFGFHAVRRPPLSEVRDRFQAYAEALATQREDTRHADSVIAARHRVVTRGAVPALRRFFEQPATNAAAPDTLATWDGGALTLGEIALWINLLPPRGYLDLRGASDNALAGFVRDISLQSLLLDEAEAAGLSARGEWKTLYEGYRRGLRESLALLGLGDSTSRIAEGEVPGRVAALLDGLSADRVTWRPLPSALGAVLRARAGYRLNRAGLDRAVRLALDATQ